MPSCTQAKNMHVETVKYFTNKYLLLLLKIQTLLDVKSLILSVFHFL